MAVDEIDVGSDKSGVTVGSNVPLVCNGVAVGTRAKVGVAGLGDAQAVSKTKPISKTIMIDLVFIFTSIDNYIACHIITEKAETRTSKHYTTAQRAGDYENPARNDSAEWTFELQRESSSSE